MNKLIFLIGLPGSGKSTYASKYLSQDCEILSSDRIRKELLNDEKNQENNQLVFSTLFERAKQFLTEGKNVVIDATNVNLAERQASLENFKDFNVRRIAIVINTPFKKCVERDRSRERSVGIGVIRKFERIFTKPTKKEGFDEIIYVK